MKVKILSLCGPLTPLSEVSENITSGDGGPGPPIGKLKVDLPSKKVGPDRL